MDKSEILKSLEQFAKPYKEKLGIYGIRLRIEVDPDFEWPNERYRTLVNDELFSNDLTEEEAQMDIEGLAATFEIFKKLPARNLERIIRDRETRRISDCLATWEDKTWEFLPSDMVNDENDEDEFQNCPCIKCKVDEVHITDTDVHYFYVHRISMDDNGNVKLVGRIASSENSCSDELYTYLGSVDAFDLEEIDVPVYNDGL